MVQSPYQIAQTWTGTREGDAKLDDFLNNGGQNHVSKASDMARSWLNVGSPTKEPKVGDLAVFSRGSNPALGHVGFFEGYNPDGSIKVLGGNQSDMVKSASYPAQRLLGFRALGGPTQQTAAAANAVRGGSMNGGYGQSPTGTAGIAGPIQTTDKGHMPADQAPFKDFQSPATPAPQVSGWAAEATPAFSPDFNTSDVAGSLMSFGNALGKMMGQGVKPPAAPVPTMRGPNPDLSMLAKVLAGRQKKGI